jgi:hypothetical protein
MTSREFLFQLTDKSLVHRFERFSQFVRNIEENCGTAASAVNFLGSGNVKIPKGCLELRGGHLKVEKLLGNRGLEFIGLRLLWWKGTIIKLEQATLVRSIYEERQQQPRTGTRFVPPSYI